MQSFIAWYHCDFLSGEMDTDMQEKIRLMARQVLDDEGNRWRSRYDSEELPAFSEVLLRANNLCNVAFEEEDRSQTTEYRAAFIMSLLAVAMQVLSPPLRTKPCWRMNIEHQRGGSMFPHNK